MMQQKASIETAVTTISLMTSTLKMNTTTNWNQLSKMFMGMSNNIPLTDKESIGITITTDESIRDRGNIVGIIYTEKATPKTSLHLSPSKSSERICFGFFSFIATVQNLQLPPPCILLDCSRGRSSPYCTGVRQLHLDLKTTGISCHLDSFPISLSDKSAKNHQIKRIIN